MKAIENLLIVGVGLIGGSYALRLKREGLARRIVGFGRNRKNLERAVELGIIDDIAGDLASAATQADLIMLAVPVKAMSGVFAELSNSIRPDCVITDGGSTKQEPIAMARAALGDHFSRFVPGHPIAGSEQSGVEAVQADLYDDHKVLLTPLGETDADAIELVKESWRCCGARVEQMHPADHDRVLALTSHLPHVLAYALVDNIARCDDARMCFDLAAGGFLDFTRIASSDPIMWRDICLSNQRSVIAAIDQYAGALKDLREHVEQLDSDALERTFLNARESRNRLLDRRRNGNGGGDRK